MSLIILLIVASCSSQGSALNIRGYDNRDPIIFNSASGQDKILLDQSPPWVSLARGQFMRDIMFNIHPDSPPNREVWMKSGLFRQNDELPRNIHLPIMNQGQGDLNPKSDNKGKRPLRRKLIPTSKRLPKLSDLNEDTTIKKNITEAKTNPNRPQAFPQPPGQSVPLFIPPANSEASKVPRCFVQTTVPVVYYLLPIAPRPFVQPNRPNKPSLFETNQYAPIQNRLPYPPRIVYLSTVPFDLLAMEGVKDEQQLSFAQATKTKASVSPDYKQIIKEEKIKVSGSPEIIDVEFRRESLPLELPAKDAKLQNSPVMIEEQVQSNVQEEEPLREEFRESVTLSEQEIVTLSE